jgi:hypothetical protein
MLYIALYAADEDLHATQKDADGPLWLDDAFHVSLRTEGFEHSFDVSPRGTLTDARRTAGGAFDFTWQSGAHVASDVDGTLDDSTDDDEEWVIEMGIPFDAIGARGVPGERIPISLRRCDTPKRSPRVCATWGEGPSIGVLILD